jgi:hypothetical protein
MKIKLPLNWKICILPEHFLAFGLWQILHTFAKQIFSMFLSLSILKLSLSLLETKYSDFWYLKQCNVTLQIEILQKKITRVRWKNANKDQCRPKVWDWKKKTILRKKIFEKLYSELFRIPIIIIKIFTINNPLTKPFLILIIHFKFFGIITAELLLPLPASFWTFANNFWISEKHRKLSCSYCFFFHAWLPN